MKSRAANVCRLKSGDSFEKACELILHKKLDLLAVVDEKSMPVGIITRNMC